MQAAFRSYSHLDESRPDTTYAVESVAGVREAMSRAAEEGRTLAFHGSGASLHDQALSADGLVVLDGMPRRVALDGTALVADGRATWGDAFATALDGGLIPAVMPTSSRITLGGSLAANVVSRFTVAHGRVASGVQSFELLPPSGDPVEIVRPAPGTSPLNDALFRAVPGSFGFLGLVSRLRLQLLPFPFEARVARPRVETFASTVKRLDDLVAPMIEAALASKAGPGLLNGGHTDATGLSTWALTDPTGLGCLFRSRYVSADRPLRSSVVHRPGELGHAITQLATASRFWMDLAWKHIVWRGLSRVDRPFVDSLDGFTFMMDGNWRAREWAARWGFDVWALQQSYVLPVEAAAADPGQALKQFLEHVRGEVHDARLKIGVIDLLATPPDDTLFSMPKSAILVTPAIQGLSRRDSERVIAVLRRLSRACAGLGGQVHLVKHVYAEPDVLRAMYGPAITRFLELKRQLDPRGVLRNAFLERLIEAAG